MEFVLAYGHLAAELARLLEVRFIPDDPSHMGHTGRALMNLMLLNNAGTFEERDVEFTRLAMFVHDLQGLERERPDVLALLRRKLQDPNEHNYFGSRHELSTAVALLERGIVDFTYEGLGRPDFQVELEGESVGIECGSVHLTGASPLTGPLHYKLQSCIRAKAHKPYADRAVALSIDATNVQALALQNGVLLWGNDQDPWLDEAAAASPFGSLLLCATMVNRESEDTQLQRTFGRFDSPTAAAALVECLNRVFPQDWTEVKKYSVLPRT